MALPKITIGLDAASRAKYKSSLAAQLSFFSITQTDDPIPRTNFSFSVYYVLGALAALLYALLDPSCVEVTAYRTDVPIDDCTSMLASFACRTADFDLATGEGFTRTYNSLTCLGGKNTSEGVLGTHQPSKCPDIQEASFKCKTADYDQAAGTGLERTFTPAACPSQADTLVIPVYNDSYPPSTCLFLQEDTFDCRTADYDATTTPVTGYKETFNVGTCPTTGSGTATGDVHSWHSVSSCGSLAETNVKCRRASGCGFDVAGTVDDSGGGPDFSYGGLGVSGTETGVTSTMSCEECVKTANGYTATGYNDAHYCRHDYGLCCGLEPSWYTAWTDKAGWVAHDDGMMGTYTTTADNYETGGGYPYCPAGSMSLASTACAATRKTACDCPADVQTGKTVTKSACGDPQAVDYSSCGTACGKTYDSSAGRWDVGGTPFYSITGAVEATSSSGITSTAATTGLTYWTYDECFGNFVNAPVTYTACAGTRDVPVVFDTCTGTVEVDVSYTVCDGFVTVCPETPMSVRFSQAMAYSAAWMSALAFVYNYLGQRELAKRVENLVQKNDLDESDDEDAPAEGAEGAKTADVTATVKLRGGRANRV